MFCSSLPRLGHHPDTRTEGEAVSETAWRLTRLVLHPKQVTVMQNSDPMVFLTGPPGTGKTLMLVLKGLDWLRHGNDHVQVISTWQESLAASHMIADQLEQSAGPAAGQRVHLHTHTFEWSTTASERRKKKAVKAVVQALMTAAQGGRVLVIADEVVDNKYVHIFSWLPTRQCR